MTTNENTGVSPHESVGEISRVTATTRRTEGGHVYTEYEVDGRVLYDIGHMEAILGGED